MICWKEMESYCIAQAGLELVKPRLESQDIYGPSSAKRDKNFLFFSTERFIKLENQQSTPNRARLGCNSWLFRLYSLGHVMRASLGLYLLIWKMKIITRSQRLFRKVPRRLLHEVINCIPVSARCRFFPCILVMNDFSLQVYIIFM